VTAENNRSTFLGAYWSFIAQHKYLEDHLELLRCHYNFVRPHSALKFGREVRTPSMQAGLTTRRLSLREIFSATKHFLARRNVTLLFFDFTILVNVDDSRVPMAA
jgi:hypothetical protein